MELFTDLELVGDLDLDKYNVTFELMAVIETIILINFMEP
jgi:hypothetical protein